MEAQQTFIIEASQQNSVEAPTTDNYSAWTNRVEPTLLRRGDYISLNTAIVSQRGASGASNIEFTDEYTNDTNNLQSNFTLMKIGYYLCNNNVNSCPLPFKYARRQTDNSNPSKKTDGTGRVRTLYDVNRFKEIDGHQVVNNEYLLGVWNDPFIEEETDPITEFTCDALSSFENRNPEIKIDGQRFAKVGNDYNGWARNDNGDKNSVIVDLLTQDIPLHIEKGFKDARSVGETLTRTLQTTNEPYSNDAEYAVPQSTLFTIAPNERAQTQNNPRFNGYCMKSIGANLQKYDSSVSNPLYNNLCVRDPFKWKFGSQLVSNTETNLLENNVRINEDYQNVRPYTKIPYPVLLWSTWNQAPPLIENDVVPLVNYNFYSPFFTDVEEGGGDNVIEWSGFSGVMSDYNDYYAEIYDYEDDENYQDGTMVFKSGSDTYYFYNPPDGNHYPTDPADGNRKLQYLSFRDGDNVSFDRITAWNAKNSLGSNGWSVKGENVLRWSNVFAQDFFFSPAGPAQGEGELHFGFDLDPNDTTKYVKGTIYLYNFTESTNGSKNIWGLNPAIGFEAGKKYKIRFQSTLQSSTGGGTSSNYAGSYYIYYRSNGATPVFYQIDEDKNGTDFHEIIWTQGAATGARYDALFINIVNNVSFTETIKLVNFQLLEANLEEGDIYTITDIFYGSDEDNMVNSRYTTKIYKLRVNNGQLRNEKFDVVGSTIFGGIFNEQYTPVAVMPAYKNGNDIIAFDGVNSGDHDHPVIMLYKDDPNFDYIIYNQYGSKVWRIAQITKAPNEIVSGTTIGTIQGGNETSLRNPFRSGQQLYDFSVGNTWSGTTKNILKDIPNPFDATSTFTFDPTGCDIHYTYVADDAFEFEYLAPETQTWKYVQSTLTESITANEDITISFDITNVSNPGNPLPQPFRIITSYIEGGVNYNPRDFTAEGNHSFSFTTTQAPINPALPIYWGFFNTHTISGDVVRISNFTIERHENISMTSHITTSPLPTITAGAPVNKTLSYSTTFDIHVSYGPNLLHLYLAFNNPGDADDTDLQGKRGRLVWDDGGVWNETSWDWDGATTLDLDIDGGISLTADGGTPTLTNTLQYETAQRINIGATPYDFPINGKQYGYSSVDLLGTGTLSTNPHLPLPVSNNDVNEVFLAIGDMTDFDNGYSSGSVYETITEDDTNEAICQWEVIFNDDETCDLNFFSNDGTQNFLSLEERSSNVVRYGWVLFKCEKFDTIVGDPNGNLTILDGEDYYTGSRSYGLTGANGRYIGDGAYNFPNDTGTTQFLEDENLQQYHANMPRSTMLMTNIKYNMDNLKIVENYFRQTEVYDGDIESSRADIAKDVENYYANFQIGRTDDNQLQVDRTIAPYTDSEPAFQYYMNDYGKMGNDDSDDLMFIDPNGNVRKGSNKNFGCVCPKMTSKSGHRQNLDVYTRWKGSYTSRLLADNRLSNRMGANAKFFEDAGWLYGKEISEAEFKRDYPDLYNYAVNNNVGVYPYLLRDDSATPAVYDLCMAFETYRDIDRNNPDLLKIQDLTWFGFSPSFLDNDYITPINTDTPYMKVPPDAEPKGGLYGYTPNYVRKYNMNLINIGSAPVCQYDADLNRFQFNYFHTPFKFNENTGVDADLGEEIALLNSNTLMIMKQGIAENNLESGGTTGDNATPPTQVHLGLADAQCGIYLMDIYGQTPSQSYITDSNNGTLITRNNYDNTLFYTLGFSYYDLKPIRFKPNAFNNRFNPNTYNTIATTFRTLGTSPFTTNSAVNISDQIKTNIFTGVNLHRDYASDSPFHENTQTTANTNEGTPAFYLGYNSLLASTIKTQSANMTSRSVIVQLQAPFYRVYCDLPLDTMSYLTDGSLSCVGYMTKNYQSQSFIYSFASDYGGYLTRDVLLTNLRTEIRNPKGLLVSSLDPNSAIFYKVVRNIKIQPGLTPKQEEEQAKQLLERQEQEAEEATEQRVVSLDVIKFFKQLFSGMNTDAMTEALGEPSGVDEVYQDAQLEQKEEEAIEVRPVIPTLNLGILDGMTEEEAEVPYDTREHRLFVRMSEVMEDALTDAQTQTPRGVVQLAELDKSIRQLQLGGSVLDKLIKGLNNVNDRKELRKLVEDTIGETGYTTIAQRKKRATQILRVLEKAQEISIKAYPNLMGKNPVRRGNRDKVYTDPTTGGKKLLTARQREETERKAMIRQDKERRGRPSARKLLLREEMGKEHSPLRRRGRRILQEREKKEKMGGGKQLFKDTSGGASK